MKNVFFEIGDRIELTHYASRTGRTLSEKKYGSKLLDFDGIRTAKLAMPIEEGKLIPLEPGDQYQLCFFTNSGLYQCRGKIQKRYSDNGIHVMDVLLITELKKFQRRRFYRLDIMFPLQFRIMTDVEILLRARLEEDHFETPEDKEICIGAIGKLPRDWQEGTVSDISGGGIRFLSKKKLDEGLKMEVMVPLSFPNGIVPMRFCMKVISCSYYKDSRIVFEVRGEFENVKDEERETVIRYVFEEQRRRIMRKE